MIHIIQRERGGFITVYRGKSPHRKAWSLRRESAKPYLILIASAPGEHTLQASIHDRLKPHRVRGLRGRWYRPEPEVIAFAESLRGHEFPRHVEADGGALALLGIDSSTGKTSPCPFCGARHIHGEGASGHKAAHCDVDYFDEVQGPAVTLRMVDGYIVEPHPSGA